MPIILKPPAERQTSRSLLPALAVLMTISRLASEGRGNDRVVDLLLVELSHSSAELLTYKTSPAEEILFFKS